MSGPVDITPDDGVSFFRGLLIAIGLSAPVWCAILALLGWLQW